jgi:transcriptional regulator with XRE-family HTH domain
MKIIKIFGVNVRKRRLLKGWSQEELAEAAGLHRTYVSQIEVGKRNPTLEIVARFAAAFKTHPSELLQEDGE